MTPAQTNERAEYGALLANMADDRFVKEVETRVWLSSFAANNPRSKYHWQCDACYDEAQRREAPWLYQRGWNQAYQSCGYDPSDDQIEAAKGPSTSQEAAE